jgi:hypothetical protein
LKKPAIKARALITGALNIADRTADWAVILDQAEFFCDNEILWQTYSNQKKRLDISKRF